VISEHVSLSRFGNAYDGKARHLAALAVVDDREGRPIRERVHVPLIKLAGLPLLILTL